MMTLPETASAYARRTECPCPTGIVLPLVLIILIAIAILSMDYLSRSDLELAAGQNMVLRAQMDSLADSGLEHAKGLLLNPQDTAAEYWRGAVRQQLVPGSSDYYDVNVAKLGRCNYQVVCTARRLHGGEWIGRTTLQAELRLDPCIAYWQGGNVEIPVQANITGDAYGGGRVAVAGRVYGDVFAAEAITVSGQVYGQRHEFTRSAPVAPPGLSLADFRWYYFVGQRMCWIGILHSWALGSEHLQPTLGNPAGIYRCDEDLHLSGRLEIDGTLVVKHDLILEDGGDVVVRAVKNFPALLVGHDIEMRGTAQRLRVEGLVQVGHAIEMGNGAGNTIEITGALCLLTEGVKQTAGCGLTVQADADKAALQLWSAPAVARRWSPAGGAFFKSIVRQ